MMSGHDDNAEISTDRMAGAAALPSVWRRVRLLILRGSDPRGVAGLDDVVETLRHAFAALGAEVDVAFDQPIGPRGTNVVFCGEKADSAEAVAAIPANSVIFNTEQFASVIFERRPHYASLLRRFPIWDYSIPNATYNLSMALNWMIHLLPVGYMPQLSRIDPAPVQDIDVLFYGTMNERRLRILQELQQAGLRVEAGRGLYGAERDAAIARAKIVLNVHFYESKVHEVVRTSYLLANHKAVVSECGDDTEIESDIRKAIIGVPYERLVETCVALCRDDVARRRAEENGFEIFSRRDQIPMLRHAIETTRWALPRSINLGSGKSWNPGSLNIDIDPKWRPDILADLSDPATLGQSFQTERFGLVTLEPGSFERIVTMDVLEHVGPLVELMTNCLALLCHGGVMKNGVPYDLSYGAWQDPTHVRAFNENSWLYYTTWFWYLGWREARFDLTDIKMILSPYGQSLHAGGMAQEPLFRQPRAVDSMDVTLTKRPLTPQEKAKVDGMLDGF